MKLLLDENRSPRLIPRLLSLFAGLTHVREVGLQKADDQSIWKWAKENHHTIITADADFVTLSRCLGWPPQVIHIKHCDFPFRVIEETFLRNAVRISEFDRDRDAGLLILRVSLDDLQS